MSYEVIGWLIAIVVFIAAEAATPPILLTVAMMKMKEMPDAKPNLDALIENFDQALSHPDQEDLERLRRMITG